MFFTLSLYAGKDVPYRGGACHLQRAPLWLVYRMNDCAESILDFSATAFGRSFGEFMAECDFVDGCWQAVRVHPLQPLSLHPATHALHYASACFEGIKAFRHPDGGVHLFRMDRHIACIQEAACGLHLPVPPADTLGAMLTEVVQRNASHVPEPLGALYLRPVLFGTDANVGAATEPSLNAKLLVLACPVGDYFSPTEGTFTVRIIDDRQRAVPGIAGIKAAANYASALAPIMAARQECGADQVLFCPGGDVQETGTSNFFLIDENALLTKPADDQFLPGITRDSILVLAEEFGYDVIERDYKLDTLFDWLKYGEAALCDTAAVLTPIATFLYKERSYRVNEACGHPHVNRLKQALLDIQFGLAADRFGWMSPDMCIRKEASGT